MNESNGRSRPLPTVLMAEDDGDDRFFLYDAFRSVHFTGELRFVEDGEELMAYLRRRGKFADPELSPRPAMILLDLNMPRKDGRKALLEIKSDPALMDIPIVIWTTSDLKEDKVMCIDAGADAFMTKPDNYRDLETAVAQLCIKWLV